MLVVRSDASVALLMAVAVLAVVLGVSSWVYRDARAHAAVGNPVYLDSRRLA